jgi:phospholipid transport system transporter-binding protein
MLLLPVTLTVREANDTLRMLEQNLRGDSGSTIVIDATPLRHFDSSALAVLLECRRLAGNAGKGFELRNLPPKLFELASLYGVGELLGVAQAA